MRQMLLTLVAQSGSQRRKSLGCFRRNPWPELGDRKFTLADGRKFERSTSRCVCYEQKGSAPRDRSGGRSHVATQMECKACIKKLLPSKSPRYADSEGAEKRLNARPAPLGFAGALPWFLTKLFAWRVRQFFTPARQMFPAEARLWPAALRANAPAFRGSASSTKTPFWGEKPALVSARQLCGTSTKSFPCKRYKWGTVPQV